MAVYYKHDLIKIVNLARILDSDPYYSSSENREKLFFVDGSMPTILNSIGMLYEWESHGLTPAVNNNVNILKTRLYSIQGLRSFLTKYNFPLPAALFPAVNNNSDEVYFTQVADEYLDTGNQTLFAQKRHRNNLLNKFFFNSEIVHREDYCQFEAIPISQPVESNQIRMDALKEVQSVWLELKRNKFNDELQIVQEWIDGYVSKKSYFVEWKLIKDISEIDASIKEYESITPASITEISIRDKALTELRDRKFCLQARAYAMKNTASTPQGRQIGPAEDVPAPAPVAEMQEADGAKVQERTANTINASHLAVTTTTWGEIHITFVNDFFIEIHCRGDVENKSFNEIGFSDGRKKDEPNSLWCYLKCLPKDVVKLPRKRTSASKSQICVKQ